MTASLIAALALCLPAAPAPLAFDDDPVERLDAWPALDRDVEDVVETDVERVRKARTPEMAEFAREGLIGVGAGAAPHLIEALGAEKDEAARGRLVEILTAVTDAPHTRLLAAEFEHDALEVRVFCLGRAAAFPDAGTGEAAAAAYERVVAWKDDRRNQRKYDVREHDAAALAATAGGSFVAFDHLLALAREDWGERGGPIRVALTAVRGVEATRRVTPALASDERREIVAALRALSGCGDREEAVRDVAPFLDSDDNSIRVAAINALRGIVDGDPPIEQLSVFDAIELAKQWQERL